MKQKGTLPIEGQEDFIESGDPDHNKIIRRLKELNITPKQLAIELKASSLQHAEHLKDLVEEELKQ